MSHLFYSDTYTFLGSSSSDINKMVACLGRHVMTECGTSGGGREATDPEETQGEESVK